MSCSALDRAFRSASARIIGVLAARYRDLDLAEEAFAEACARALSAWTGGVPSNPQGWLFHAAQRCAIDALRKRKVREGYPYSDVDESDGSNEQMFDDSHIIPDERLRLIFICCHPAVAPDSRAALTLRLVCGLTTVEIARAFLVTEPAMAQRLVRAKRKIAGAGVPFEIPPRNLWSERVETVLSTLEVAYSKAHEDAAGTGPHAGYATEILELTAVLANLLPDEPDVLAFGALVRFAEARRPARVDASGRMVALVEQDPLNWDRALIVAGANLLRQALRIGPAGVRQLQALIHEAWCARRSLEEPAPWRRILSIYDALIELRDDPITRLNRIVALAEVRGSQSAIAELDRLDAAALGAFLPYHAVRADLLRRTGLLGDAREEYEAALALSPNAAEAAWLIERRDAMAGSTL